MALELAPHDIRVNAVAPGAIRGWRTPSPDHEKVRALSARIPLGRMGTDMEVASVVAFLASDEASYITGQVLTVDGGISAQLSPPGQPI
jgi:NAD(P)-dependent dehydrogenase (short-subunit alcohol dehydrogenase family)